MTTEAEKELLLRVAGELDAAKVRPTWEPLPFGAIVLYGEELDTIARVLREAAEGPWKQLPPPNDMDIIVLHDNGNSEFIPAEDNDFRWKANYGPKIDGITSPILWMPLPAPPSETGNE